MRVLSQYCALPYMYSYSEFNATLEIFAWVEVNDVMKAQCKSAQMAHGGQCVMTVGTPMMQGLYADSLDMKQAVSWWQCSIPTNVCLQVPLL